MAEANHVPTAICGFITGAIAKRSTKRLRTASDDFGDRARKVAGALFLHQADAHLSFLVSGATGFLQLIAMAWRVA
jgi:hypothetical protein